jgi:hypothetical protein
LKRRRLDFTVYGGKNRVLDRFFNTMMEDETPRVDLGTPLAKMSLPKIAYGACSLSPTGKGEKSVPVKYIAKRCEARFPLDYIDEGYPNIKNFDLSTVLNAINIIILTGKPTKTVVRMY